MKPNKIIFIQDVKGLLKEGVDLLEKQVGYKLKPIVIKDTSTTIVNFESNLPEGFSLVGIDFSSKNELGEYVKSIKDSVLLVTCRSETSMHRYLQFMEYLPSLPAPSRDSVETALSKKRTRERMNQKAPGFSIKYTVIQSTDIKELKRTESLVGYPCIVKPAGLDSSLLIQKCTNRRELKAAIIRIEIKIEELYASMSRRGDASIVVEQMMAGDMYSIDVFVTPSGEKYFCPITRVVTGAEIGLNDFFGYIRRTPIKIDAEKIEKAHEAASMSIDALDLRATTCHVELFDTKDGWKLIEIGPRTGGYRDQMHTNSVGIPYAFNDLAVRTNTISPNVTPTKAGFSAVINFYPRSEGRLKESIDESIVTNLQSYNRHKLRYSKGDPVSPAKFGGRSILSVTLVHKLQSVIESDIKSLEESLPLEVTTH